MFGNKVMATIALACLGLIALLGGCSKSQPEPTPPPSDPPPMVEKQALDLGSALWASMTRCEPKPIENLIASGADVNSVHGELKTTPLVETVRNGEYWCAADLCKILLKAGADVNKPDVHGDTALHWAARQQCIPQYVEVINVLLSYGANPKLINRALKTPFDVAIEAGCTAKLGILGGAMPKQTGSGAPPITTNPK